MVARAGMTQIVICDMDLHSDKQTNKKKVGDGTGMKTEEKHVQSCRGMRKRDIFRA